MLVNKLQIGNMDSGYFDIDLCVYHFTLDFI